MPATQRELKDRRSSVSTIKKLTRAMELIAAFDAHAARGAGAL